MTSIAALTHTPAPAFNGLFYATAATVIPVLFLALAVQGRVYTDLLRAAQNYGHFRRTTLPPPELTAGPARWVFRLTMAAINASLWLAAWLIPLAGFYGELGAIVALYRRTDSNGIRLTVLAATLLLLVGVAAGPVIAISRPTHREQRESEPGKTDPA
jgi:hypothetical protein